MMRLHLKAAIAVASLCVAIATAAAAPEYCCRTLELGSKGALAVSEQKHIIGTYLKRERDDGRLVYRQTENYQKYLYYMPEYSVRHPSIYIIQREAVSVFDRICRLIVWLIPGLIRRGYGSYISLT